MFDDRSRTKPTVGTGPPFQKTKPTAFWERNDSRREVYNSILSSYPKGMPCSSTKTYTFGLFGLRHDVDISLTNHTKASYG